MTRSGLFKRQRSFSDVTSTRTKENDAVSFVRFGSTRAPLILLSSLGKAYTLLVDQVPATTGHGTPIATVFKLEDGEQIIGAYIDDPRFLCPAAPRKETKTLLDLMAPAETDDGQNGRYIVAVSRQAQVVRIALDSFSVVSSTTGRYYMRLNPGDTVIRTAITREEGFVSLISDNTRANVFPVIDVPVLKTAGKGYRAIGLDPGTAVAAARIVKNPEEGVRIELSDHREITISERRLAGGERGGKGRLLMRRGTILRVVEDPQYDIDQPNASIPSPSQDPSDPEA